VCRLVSWMTTLLENPAALKETQTGDSWPTYSVRNHGLRIGLAVRSEKRKNLGVK
jgi:hypothetical protein